LRPNTKAPLAMTLKLDGYSTAQFGSDHRAGRPVRRVVGLCQERKGQVRLQRARHPEFATESDTAIPAGTHQVRADFAYDGRGLAKGGDVTSYFEGTPVGTGWVGATQPMIFSADETTDIGYESGTTVTSDYSARDSRFTAGSTGCSSIWARMITTTSSTPRNGSGSPCRGSSEIAAFQRRPVLVCELAHGFQLPKHQL
jgi:hypothetical protein